MDENMPTFESCGDCQVHALTLPTELNFPKLTVLVHKGKDMAFQHMPTFGAICGYSYTGVPRKITSR